MYKRVQYQTITKRLKEPRHFLQVVLGPRQVGKTTVIKQVVNDLNLPYQIYSADSIPATQTSWISDCWNTARVQMRVEKLSEFILIIEEIQKIKNWSEVVKKEWDADTFSLDDQTAVHHWDIPCIPSYVYLSYQVRPK